MLTIVIALAAVAAVLLIAVVVLAVVLIRWQRRQAEEAEREPSAAVAESAPKQEPAPKPAVVAAPPSHSTEERSRDLAALLGPVFTRAQGLEQPAEAEPQWGAPSELFVAATAVLQSLVALSDRKVTEAERGELVATLSELFDDACSAGMCEKLAASLHESPPDRGALVEALRQAYAMSERKLLLLLSLQSAWADDEVQLEEEQLIGQLQGAFAISDSDLDILRIAARPDPLRSLGDIRSSDRRIESVHALADELSPAAFGALCDNAWIYHQLSRFSATLETLTESLGVSSAIQPELDEDLHEQLDGYRAQADGVRQHLDALERAVEGVELPTLPAQIEALRESCQRLIDGRFAVAVIGEFNAGKSTFINALLHDKILPTAGIPCTAVVNAVRYGAERRITATFHERDDEEVPFSEREFAERVTIEQTEDFAQADQLLDDQEIAVLTLYGPFRFCQSGIELIDTPGLNEVARRTEITMKLLRRSDVGILLSNATQPLKHSERNVVSQLLSDCPAMRLLLVASHWDRVQSTDREAVKQRYDGYVEALGERSGQPAVYFLSAYRALEATCQRPVPVANPYLEDFRSFRRELLEFLAEERGPRKIEALRTGVAKVIGEAAALCQAKYQADRDRHLDEAQQAHAELAKARAALAGELEAWGRSFPSEVGERCARMMSDALDELSETAQGWTTDRNPMWPGNVKKIELEFQEKARTCLWRRLDRWSQKELPALLRDATSAIEKKHEAALAEATRAMYPGGSAPDGEQEQQGALLSLLRTGGRWALLGPGGVLEASWDRVGLALGGQVVVGVGGALLGAGGPVASAVGTLLDLVAMLASRKDKTIDKLRARVVEAIRGRRAEMAEICRVQARRATGRGLGEMVAHIEQGLDRLVASSARELERIESGDDGSAWLEELSQSCEQLRRLQRAVDGER